jgi:2-iminoacetate synthase ThiH
MFKNKNITYENRVAKYVISETTENSAALYTCQARNDAGSAETSCQLKVQGTDTINFMTNRFIYLTYVQSVYISDLYAVCLYI